MSVTIKDVAKVAGVSPSTVSRVISDDKSISDKTKEKVRQVMREMKYFPNLNARSLVNQESNIIGLILPNSTDNFYQNPFFPTVLRGISELASQKEYTLLLSSGETDEVRLNRVQNMVYGKQVDGLIFLYSKEGDRIIDFLIDIDFPFIVIGSPEQTCIHSVDNDNASIAKELTQHLIHQGAKTIGFIGGDTQQHFMQLRFQGYLDAMEEANIPLDEALVFNDFEFLRSSGYYLARNIKDIPAIDGMIIADQLVYRGFQDGWRNFGRYDMLIATFKSYNSSDYQQEQGPYMNINAQKLGEIAMENLLSLMKKENNTYLDKRHLVKGELIK